jgi:hypothetical protein
VDSITITKAALAAALLAWEQAHRAGETRTADETAALPINQVVSESTDYLWSLLQGATPVEG